MVDQCDLSERRACRLVGLSRDSYRHPPDIDMMSANADGRFVHKDGRPYES